MISNNPRTLRAFYIQSTKVHVYDGQGLGRDGGAIRETEVSLMADYLQRCGRVRGTLKGGAVPWG